jgi:DNA polymerase-4
MPRQILHVDMDAFFAAVEQLDFPELRGKPVLVGGSRKRGVVSTASYEARVFGCRSAMPMAQALRLCPQAIVQKGRYARYREISDKVFSIFDRFTPAVESVGIDEAFLDVTGSFRLFGDGESIAKQIRKAIRAETGLAASVGVAPNKFLAKLGSDLNKPDGLAVITPETLDAILGPLSISRIWGVGAKTAKKLEGLNIKTIGDLRAMDEPFFDRFFGEWGERVYQLIRGIDDREVTGDHEAKSIGQEQTFHDNIHDPDVLRGILLEQVEEVGARLRRKGRCSAGLSLKIRYGDFKTITRSRKLDTPTDVTQVIWQAALGLFDEWAREHLAPLRLLGMQCTHLTESGQLPLFGREKIEKQQRLDRAVDSINQKFASTPVQRARLPQDREES